jgi:coproporphyrinogen III oxidase
MKIDRTHISGQFQLIQDMICSDLEKLDGVGRFLEEGWTMKTGGGGRTRVIEGQHIEKGGVKFSAVQGPVSPALQNLLKKAGEQFFATGVSIVLHPINPWVPIIHMNIRYFEMDEETWWFGGGIDLTPHYINPREAKSFHIRLKKVCDLADTTFYPTFKKWADDYFYLKHRSETRGVGGIFFDRLSSEQSLNKEDLFEFVKAVGLAFVPAYKDIFTANFERSFSDQEKAWQYYRRGRYAEFNLVWDRGTRFGLETGGRTESILMSLPPKCIWIYNRKIPEGSAEYASQILLRKEIDWVNFKV